MNIQDLKNELKNDPANLGYGPLLDVADDITVAALINKVGNDLVLIPVLTRGQFLLNIVAPVGSNLLTATPELKAKWNFYLDLAKSAETIEVTSAVIQSLLNQLVSDGIATQEMIDAATKRLGSRAEVLFGSGTVVTPEQIGAAR